MIPPYHLRVASLLAEEVLIESGRERLIARARHADALAEADPPRRSGEMVPLLMLGAIVGAIIRWFLALG